MTKLELESTDLLSLFKLIDVDDTGHVRPSLSFSRPAFEQRPIAGGSNAWCQDFLQGPWNLASP